MFTCLLLLLLLHAVVVVNHVEAEARLSGVKPLSCSSHRQDTRGGGVQKVHDLILIVSQKAYDTGSRLEAEVGPRGSSPSAVFLIGGTRGRGGPKRSRLDNWTTGNDFRKSSSHRL